jgi:multiple sugar transport system ATP-binding protein
MRSEGEAIYTGRFSPRSTAKPGQRLDIVVDTARMHFFDPATGNAIRG